ncbi:hypothetical protein QOZ80_6BG0493220 [Eleusine coracana subsp. coracana]|nr:hypothetical protein QOZ80_6BG0493220 [Eleusine coracana subsp. coracana]
MASPSPLRRVCVTGGGGFIASWLVKLLLSRGYSVHATLRDPDDPKNAHLKKLDGAPDNLTLFKADVLHYDSLKTAIAGCQGVFHLASPVPEDKIVDPELEMLAPAVKGTSSVLQICSSTKVQKLVVVSSTSAVHFNPNWPQDKPKDESCWSDRKLCMETGEWYSAGKTAAEETVWEYAEKSRLKVVTVCPCLVFGPVLQPTVNTSSKVLMYTIKGGPNAMKNFMWHIVDVRDVADALVLVYEKPESSGRYICGGDNISTKDMVELLKKNYPTYNYVNCNIDIDLQFAPISSEKLRSLGWKPRELEETLLDSADCYEKEGILQDVSFFSRKIRAILAALMDPSVICEFWMLPACAYLPLVDRPTSTTPPVGDEGCKPAGIPWFVDMASSPPPRVCVTGGGGFVASWLIKLLLSRGYAVHATVSDPCDLKNAHLSRLEGAAVNLRLFNADLLDPDALAAAITGCKGVFHVACPVPMDKVADPEVCISSETNLAGRKLCV